MSGRRTDFGILGPVEVARDGKVIGLPGAKVSALLGALVLHRGEVVSADALAEALWGDDPPDSWSVTLQGYVSQLRRALGPELIQTRAPGYVLAVEASALDAGHFEDLVAQGRAAQGRGEAEAATQLLRQALSLWRGPALGELARFPFAQPEAARLEELRLVATEGLIEAELATGGHANVVGRLQSLVAAHPLRERLWAQLTLALYRSGRQAEALRALSELRRRLGEELGIEPGPALRRLEADVLAQRAELDWRPAPAPGPEEVPTNLPVARSSFVGREEELAELDKALATPGLLTLVGPGGVGKTRLATEAARRLRSRHPDGVWLAELAPLSDPTLVPQAVATAIGVREEPGRSLTDTLAVALAPTRALVVVDNCEHVVDAAAALAEALLAAAPHLAIVATSREPLRVEGEVVWSTPSLPLAPSDDLAAEALAGVDAVRLFCERAAAQGPFALTPDNASATSALCRRLDGIPLAIELAAARSAALSPAQILARLDQRFRLLSSGRRSLPRHQTLAAAVEWSHDLLSTEERTLFRRLSVFRGFPLEAAEEVCSDPDLDRHRIAPLLADLVDRSLVVAAPHDEGTLRYSLLETLRAYAAERLGDSGEEEDVRRRHLGWLVGLTERLHAAQRGPNAQVWRARLTTEHDNVRHALSWAVDSSPEDALVIVGNAGLLWATRGLLEEAYSWARAALAAGTDAPVEIRALALRSAGILARTQGDSVAGTALLKEALAGFRSVGNGRLIADVLSGALAGEALQRGDLSSAVEMHEEALAVSSEISYQRGVAWATGGLALIAMRRGDAQRARLLLEESVAGFRAVGNHRDIAQWQMNLGIILLDLGEDQQGRRLLEESLTIQRELGDRRVLPYSLTALGESALRRGDYEAASSHLEEVIAVAREAGMPLHVARALRRLGLVALRQARFELAGTRLCEALERAGGADYEELPAYVEAVAALATALGESNTAVRLLGGAEAMRERMSNSMTPIDRAQRDDDLNGARQGLGDDAFTAAWNMGATLSCEEVLALAKAVC